VVLVNLATLAWASNAVLGRWLRGDIGPFTLSALRFGVATACLCLLLRRRAPEERVLGADRWWILIMGLTGVAAFSPLLYLGLRYSTAVNSSLIQGFSPLITAVIAGALIQEPVTGRQVAGAVIGLVGVAGLICGGSWEFFARLNFNPGDLILLASAVVWAFYAVFGRRVMRHRSSLSATALSSLTALPFLIAAAALELQYISLNLRLETVLAIVHICLVPTLLGFWAWNQAVRMLGAGRAMVFYNTLPLYGVLMGATLLDEPFSTAHWIFGGLILAGGIWGTLGGIVQKG
jgi:drug/metabolite transporter (DMT)-like permease